MSSTAAPRALRDFRKDLRMNWEEPAVIEIKMDAEIGSYQDDFDGQEEPPTVRAATLAAAEA